MLISISYNCVKEGLGVLSSFFLFKVPYCTEVVAVLFLLQPDWVGRTYISARLGWPIYSGFSTTGLAHVDFINLWPTMNMMNRTGLHLFIPDIPSEWLVWPLWTRVLFTLRVFLTFLLTMDMVPSLVIPFVPPAFTLIVYRVEGGVYRTFVLDRTSVSPTQGPKQHM